MYIIKAKDSNLYRYENAIIKELIKIGLSLKHLSSTSVFKTLKEELETQERKSEITLCTLESPLFTQIEFNGQPQVLNTLYTTAEIFVIFDVYHYGISHNVLAIPMILIRTTKNNTTSISFVSFSKNNTIINNITIDLTFDIFSYRNDKENNQFQNILEETLLSLNYDGLLRECSEQADRPQEMTFQTYVTIFTFFFLVFAILITSFDSFISLFTDALKPYNLGYVMDVYFMSIIFLFPLMIF